MNLTALLTIFWALSKVNAATTDEDCIINYHTVTEIVTVYADSLSSSSETSEATSTEFSESTGSTSTESTDSTQSSSTIAETTGTSDSNTETSSTSSSSKAAVLNAAKTSTSTASTTTTSKSSTTSESSTTTSTTSTTSTTKSSTTPASSTKSSTTSKSTTTTSTTSTSAASTSFADIYLSKHNEKRELQEDTVDVTWNDDVAEIAQAYADEYTCDGSLTHSGNSWGSSSLGENLAYGYDFSSAGAVTAWYDEISDYDFDDPGFSEGTGHFTQLVWNSSKQIGCGYKYCGSTYGYYIVCNYYPVGNVLLAGSDPDKLFRENVLPLKD